MTRLFLALFALMGLVAHAAPGEARVCHAANAEVRALAAPQAQAALTGARVALSQGLAAAPASEPRAMPALRACTAAPVAPAVRIGIDRARE